MIRDFCRQNGIPFETDWPLSQHTTFRIGGSADLVVFPENADQASLLTRELSLRAIPYFVLGKGSDVLADDAGYRGVLISTARMDALTCDGNRISAGAGCSLASVSNLAAAQGISGFEFLHGIPGSVGGGVFMNCGAYGGEIGNCISSVTWVDGTTGEIRTSLRSELLLEYRNTTFSQRPCLICSATLIGVPGDPQTISGTVRDLDARRREKQPLEYPSAGSAFKRPVGNFAGKLIEDAGLKGFRVGDAAVSEKHAGFVINLGHATAAQVKELLSLVTGRVREQTGITLEPEIRFLNAE